MKKHFLDKPILRSLFWFVVLPYRLKQVSWKKREAGSNERSSHDR